MKAKRDERYKFRSSDTVGAAAAEDDADFLTPCFVDGGEVSRLKDCSDPACIVLGRTGSGKSALLLHFCEENSRAIELDPHDLALSYLANSSILQFVESLGVKVDILLRLLWRHALIVEVLKAHFAIKDESQKFRFFDWFSRDREREEKHRRAHEYLNKWGDKFWERTEVRVKEFVSSIETELRAKLGVSFGSLDLGVASAEKIGETARSEIRYRAQDVVNSVQVKELSAVLDLLDDILEDRQKPYYVVIDRLDEDWAEEGLRMKLIRALIDTCREFRKVKHAKVILALRSDLVDRVFRETRDTGFQEEKIQSLYLRIRWERQRLELLLDKRINHLIRKSYEPKAEVRLSELLPKSVRFGRQKERLSGVDYLLQRTMMRPRDAISFLNCVIEHSGGRAEISVHLLKTAEGEYSRGRIRALQEEWNALYPSLAELATVLGRRRATFIVAELEDACMSLASSGVLDAYGEDDPLVEAVRKYCEGGGDFMALARVLVSVFYSVGLVGLKLTSMDSPHWTSLGQRAISPSEISEETRCFVHPCFWRVLGSTDTHASFRPA